MTAIPELHPIARELLEAYASQSYFQSQRLTATIAERSPVRCVEWALNLVEPAVLASTPPKPIANTLTKIRSVLGELAPNELAELDQLSWRSWCHGSFNERCPYLQRAVARLGWATVLLICNHANADYKSQVTGIHFSATINGNLRELANQCAMAVDMVYTDTNDGRLMVASAFTREMDRES